ncbi:Peptidase A8, signal peptidase II [Candidatus Magnetoovum chiemensis]|nr:Peptidase A8, signal peptidase II [Candidatus Magnetoovum chiemensis]
MAAMTYKRERILRTYVFFVISLLICAADQITKDYIHRNLTLHEIIPITQFFNIVHYRNIGSAFGMFKGVGNPIFIALSVIIILAVSAMIMKTINDRLALSFFLGGAAGNMIDRIARGYVVDFLDVHIGLRHWPAFNVADSALTVGIILLILGQFSALNRKTAR